MKPSLTVVGSINLDLVARCKRLPQAGETVTDARFERHPGGKGANQAVAAARLGADVRLIGCVGSDSFAEEALRYVAKEVRPDISVVDGPTGVALIVVAADGENEIVVAPGANAELVAEQVDFGDDAVLCQLEIPLAAVAAAAERATGFFALNAAPARPVTAHVIERADLVIVNRHEHEVLPPYDGLVALTLGADGAVLMKGGEEVARASAPRVEAVDGTAAGDAFTACLVVSLLEERSYDEALIRACASGALAASRAGAQPSLPTAHEVDAILAR